jgi:phenylpropionate dioxygenase-like ring-hydroxylating dioxygenase large terminal subunit
MSAVAGLPDPVLANDWHPVAWGHALPAGSPCGTTLLDTDLVLWRDSQGKVHAWADRCPHRGTRLSMGTIENDRLACPYHGWQFATDGRCRLIPALLQLTPDNLASCTAYTACEAYGLIWVCLGEASGAVPPFPEYARPTLRKVCCGPYEVASSGPRIIENFLDMAHFSFVHEGILGDRTRTAIADYRVSTFNDPEFGQGVRADACQAWQPRANQQAREASLVSYTYRVVRPLTAILTKLPEAQTGFEEAISLHVQPLGETTSRVWILLAMSPSAHDDAALRAFQDTIFLQDLPILENQQPRKLPLRHGAEASVACDRLSLAYRRYLIALGLRYGVIPD